MQGTWSGYAVGISDALLIGFTSISGQTEQFPPTKNKKSSQSTSHDPNAFSY
jgi:hypothetical protein